ncbi:MAG: DUF4062 domain-containing protein [Acidobacteria bacterium]|nr:DUF4062 domain-containing protein [Acidobacteriota bacterium]
MTNGPTSRAPTPHGGRLRVFVGSTSADLGRERQTLRRALAAMDGVEYVGMENFGSRPKSPREVCLREVAASHIYVGLFGSRYGSLDPVSGLSMTEIEYREARRCGLPCLIYFKADGGAGPEPEARLRALKEEIGRDLTVDFFDDPGALATKVTTALFNLTGGRAATAAPPADVSPARLHAVLVRLFDLEELKTLCFRLGVDYERLGGAGKDAKARELIAYMSRRARLCALAKEVGRQRPGADWS